MNTTKTNKRKNVRKEDAKTSIKKLICNLIGVKFITPPQHSLSGNRTVSALEMAIPTYTFLER